MKIKKSEEPHKRLEYIASHTPSPNVNNKFRPLFITGNNGAVAGCGTMCIINGKPIIVTAAHIFAHNGMVANLDYRIIDNLSDERYPNKGHISYIYTDFLKTSNSGVGISDVAFCVPGEQKQIVGNSEVKTVDEAEKSWVFMKFEEDYFTTSINTGQRFKIVGACKNYSGRQNFIILYNSVPGESGSGFVGYNGSLYVLSGTILSSELRKLYDIPDDMERITLLTELNISFM